MSATGNEVTVSQVKELLIQAESGEGVARRITRRRLQAFLDDPLGARIEMDITIPCAYCRKIVAAMIFNLRETHRVYFPGGFNVDIMPVSWHDGTVLANIRLISFGVDMSYEDVLYWLGSRRGFTIDDDNGCIWSGVNGIEFVYLMATLLPLLKGGTLPHPIVSLHDDGGPVCNFPGTYFNFHQLFNHPSCKWELYYGVTVFRAGTKIALACRSVRDCGLAQISSPSLQDPQYPDIT